MYDFITMQYDLRAIAAERDRELTRDAPRRQWRLLTRLDGSRRRPAEKGVEAEDVRVRRPALRASDR